MVKVHAHGKSLKVLIPPTPPHSTSATQGTIDFFDTCKITPAALQLANTSNDIISRYKKFTLSWQVKKESTSTHHLHIGYYKASIKH